MSAAARVLTPSGWPGGAGRSRQSTCPPWRWPVAPHAAEAGTAVEQRIEWVHEDVLTWVPEPSAYDLVSAQFMHLPAEPRESLFRRLAVSVAPGGTLLIVGHHPSDLQTTVPRPPMPELFFTAGEIAGSLDHQQWDILIADAVARPAKDPKGQDVTIHDAVLCAHKFS